MSEVAAQMPRYKCHKVVSALKIGEGPIEVQENGDAIFPIADGGFAPLLIENATTMRYFPSPGDYFVVYEDGYKSISPRKAFEEGYTRI